MRIAIHDSYLDVPDGWDALVADGSPFLELPFLRTLEQTGCAAPETGWTPRSVCVHADDGRLVAAAPGWVKDHSFGEFVPDHAWAHAAATAGLPYYPKLVVGVPFTPVTGRRLLLAADAPPGAADALLRGLQAAARGCFGVHVLFDTEAEARHLAARGAFPRLQHQYWWHNRGYATWDDFLSTLRAKPRKALRRERREIAHLRFERVMDPDPARMDHLYRFYVETTARYPWGYAYLNRAFFEALVPAWPGRVLAVLAWDGNRCVGGAFDVVKGDRLYGRTWGRDEAIRFLHFEVCYYQGIEHAIAHGLSVFEPGHGGEHKYRRGFLPRITWSNHRLADPRLHRALADHARREADRVRNRVSALTRQSVYR